MTFAGQSSPCKLQQEFVTAGGFRTSWHGISVLHWWSVVDIRSHMFAMSRLRMNIAIHLHSPHHIHMMCIVYLYLYARVVWGLRSGTIRRRHGAISRTNQRPSLIRTILQSWSLRSYWSETRKWRTDTPPPYTISNYAVSDLHD